MHGDPSDVSIEPIEGWHCSHFYYSFNQAVLQNLTKEQQLLGRSQLGQILSATGDDAPKQLQTSIVSGHKADFGVMMLDPNPLKLDSIHQRVMASALGSALVPSYSYTSITEVSEYVPSVERYGQRLIAEGETEGSPAYEAKINAYGSRLDMMNKQRLTPELSSWPATCFYPMNKWRVPDANWYTQPAEERHKMMAEHGQSGMKFAGKVTQLITVSFGFDDWEWGVTLWGTNPQYLRDIVYQMRFDEASAKYAEFGPFYVGYQTPIDAILTHCCVAQ